MQKSSHRILFALAKKLFTFFWNINFSNFSTHSAVMTPIGETDDFAWTYVLLLTWRRLTVFVCRIFSKVNGQAVMQRVPCEQTHFSTVCTESWVTLLADGDMREKVELLGKKTWIQIWMKTARLL
jgi:hypothetical protein